MPKKQLTIIITLTILVVLAGVAGFWYVRGHKLTPAPQVVDNIDNQSNQDAQNSNAEANSETPEVVTADIDTSNWQTYRNEQYGFEVKYPREWEDRFNQSQSSDPQFKNLFYRDIWGNTQKEGTEFFDGASIKISIFQDSINIGEFIQKKYAKDYQIEKKLFSNIISYQIIRKASGYDGETIKDSYMKEIFFQYKDSTFKITAYAIGKDYLQFILQLNKLLSSFNVI
ncbi:hypothetical protein COU01_03550 [Candidatus Falkowbacteria bacterium CG10_big_fil_rev_8_21_14_0_10_44_15]|uniref:PsbP C-terminal domain-containing protein n=1 Tax=Candidatus Falkowbacteria bacterium CG10_big_fil_rev_8_21_14_0_10_44_15 TaxID=1974569 RepID=A0A2H0V160_9BACT|nr:MAG: hypothetical protein COU01_03550 [Candidatus Falkowbacteria bacterium CG10_big_fil_rev_8_21_14_0_10_44_15]